MTSISLLCALFSLFVLSALAVPVPAGPPNPAGPAPAAPAPATAPKGDNAPAAAPAQAVQPQTYFDFYEKHGETESSTRLVCDGAGGSSHPRADIACQEITAIKGDAQQLVDASASTASCTSKHSDPVVVSIQGKFQGKPFDFFHQFDSLCAMKAQTSRAPAFVNALRSDEA